MAEAAVGESAVLQAPSSINLAGLGEYLPPGLTAISSPSAPESPAAPKVVDPVVAPVVEPSVRNVVDTGAPLFAKMDDEPPSWERNKPVSNGATAAQDTGGGRLGRFKSRLSNAFSRNRGGSEVGSAQSEPGHQGVADAVDANESAVPSAAQTVEPTLQVPGAQRKSASEILQQLREEHEEINADTSDLVQAGVSVEPNVTPQGYVDEKQLQILRTHGIDKATVEAARQRSIEVQAEASQEADVEKQEDNVPVSSEESTNVQQLYGRINEVLGSEFHISMTPKELTDALDARLGNAAANEDDAQKEAADAAEVLQFARLQEGKKLYSFLVDQGFSVASATPESLVECLRETWDEDGPAMFPEYAGLDDATLQMLTATSVEYAKQHASSEEQPSGEAAEKIVQARAEQAQQRERSASEAIGRYRTRIVETIKKHDMVASAGLGFVVRTGIHAIGVDTHLIDNIAKGVSSFSAGVAITAHRFAEKYPEHEDKRRKQLDRVQKYASCIAAFGMGMGLGAGVGMAVDASMGGVTDVMQSASNASTESGMVAGNVGSLAEHPAVTETISPQSHPSSEIGPPQASAGFPKNILAEPAQSASTAVPVSPIGETATSQTAEHARFPASQWPSAPEHGGNSHEGIPAIGNEVADTATPAVAAETATPEPTVATGGSVTPSSTPMPESTATAHSTPHATIESEQPLSHVLNASEGGAQAVSGEQPVSLEASPASVVGDGSGHASGMNAESASAENVSTAVETPSAKVNDTAAVQPVEAPAGDTNKVSVEAEVAASTSTEQTPQPETRVFSESASIVPGQEQFENTVTSPEAKALEPIPQTKALNGAVVQGTVGDNLTYNGDYWHIKETGLQTIQALPLDEVMKSSVNEEALTRVLQEATTLWSKGELNAETHGDIWRIFHLSNRTTSVFDDIRKDPETIQALLRLGIVK